MSHKSHVYPTLALILVPLGDLNREEAEVAIQHRGKEQTVLGQSDT
jgi:hypothetical protein